MPVPLDKNVAEAGPDISESAWRKQLIKSGQELAAAAESSAEGGGSAQPTCPVAVFKVGGLGFVP